MKLGSLVRHKQRPSWGVGVIVVWAPLCKVNFEHRGQFTLKLESIAQWLEEASSEELTPESPLLHAERWGELETAPEQRSKSCHGRAGARYCVHCDTRLNAGLYSADRTFKSCPRCSAKDGRQHVYYPCPDGFGTSPERVSDENPQGDQSYCYACRERGRQREVLPVVCAAITRR